MTFLMQWPTRPMAQALWLLALLAGCGGGGGGSDSPPTPAEIPVVLGQPGPGDPEGYLPLGAGNFWHFSGTASGDFGTVVDNLVTVSGPQTVNGAVTWVLRESSPDGDGMPVQQSVVKDANGLAVVAADPADDALTRGLVPYWELRFPLGAGSSFAQLERSQLDLGQDLDGDGRNEKVGVQSQVRVAGKEAVTVPAGSFSDALRVDRTVSLSITLSRDGRVVKATETASAWLVPHLGWVRRTRSMAVEGMVSTMDERLDAYLVDGASGGASFPAGNGLSGQTGAGGTVHVVWPAQPAGRYTVTLAGLTGNATLSVAGATCRSGLAAPGGAAPMDCTLTLPSAGPVVARLQAAQATPFDLSLAPTPAVANPVNESRVLSGGADIVGQVGPRGTSTYVVDGLASSRQVVVLSGLDQDADLHLYADNTFSMELPCTLRGVGDVLPTPEDCTVNAPGGTVYIRVTAGELNTVGASFRLRVAASPA